MGELCKPSRNDRRRSVPSCLERTDIIDWSAPATVKTFTSRWSIGVGGRGVPDIVRVTRYDVAAAASGRLEDGRKRTSTERSSDLPGGVPAKRVMRVCGAGVGDSSAWNCVGLTWSGLRRRLGVFGRSFRIPPRRRGHQNAPASIGKVCLSS